MIAASEKKRPKSAHIRDALKALGLHAKPREVNAWLKREGRRVEVTPSDVSQCRTRIIGNAESTAYLGNEKRYGQAIGENGNGKLFGGPDAEIIEPGREARNASAFDALSEAFRMPENDQRISLNDITVAAATVKRLGGILRTREILDQLERLANLTRA